MKLLLDQNRSQRLTGSLEDLYPGTIHVSKVGLESADDETVWRFALQHGLTIVSKDSDFRQQSFLFGHPPKVVWIRRGNCSTVEIEAILRDRYNDLIVFEQDIEASFLALA